MPMPTTKAVTAAGYMTSDCLSEEFSRRRIYITGEICDALAAEVCCQINHLAAVSNEDITLWIMSPGGSVSAGLAILDTMKNCGCDIQTVVMGSAALDGGSDRFFRYKGKTVHRDECRNDDPPGAGRLFRSGCRYFAYCPPH